MEDNNLIVLGIDLKNTKTKMDQQLLKVLGDISKGKTPRIIAGLNVTATKAKIQSQLHDIFRGLNVNINTGQINKLEKQADKFHKKNINAIDFEILKREQASKAFSKQLKSQMQQAVQTEKEIANVQKQSIISDTLSTNVRKSQQELISLKKNISSIDKDSDLKAKWQELFDYSKIVKSKEELTNLNAKVGVFKKEIDASGNTMARVMAEATTRMLAMMAIIKTFQLFINSVKNMIREVTELDKSLTEFRKVSELSGQSLRKFIERAYEAADSIGRTGREVIEAATEFKRAGYEIENSLKMAEAALIMTNVGDGINSVKDASSDLIAVLRGFKISETDIMTIVDKINEVSNNSPIDFNNITEGLRRVSGTLAQTGSSIDETIGLITGGYSSLRDVDMVSSGLLMISQRLRGIDEDGKAIEGLIPKLQEDFSRIAGIDIEDSNGQLRITYDILADMARVFPTLSTKQQQYLGELAAGNRQVKVLNSILQNWNDVENAIDQSTNSMGSAIKENEIYKNSIAGIKKELSSAFQDLSQTVVDSDWIKEPLKALTEFVKVLTKIMDNKAMQMLIGGSLIMAIPKAFSGAKGVLSFGKDYISMVKMIVHGNDAMAQSNAKVGKTFGGLCKKGLKFNTPTYREVA